MRVSGLREGTAAFRSFHFKPPDPVWAPSSALDEARKALRAFDPRLNLWWSTTRKRDDPERPGRWRVVEWMANQGNWSTCFYWEGENGEYRDPMPVQPIIDKLGRIAQNLAVVAQQAEEAEQKREHTRLKEWQEACRELHEDLSARHNGIRQTFGPGYIRRRRVKPTDTHDTNHQRWVKSHLKKYHGGEQ